MAKTSKAERDRIAAEAKRRSLADDGKTSRKERFALRNEIRTERGLGAEKHKRGGIIAVTKEAVFGACNTTAGGVMPFESAEPNPPTLVSGDTLTQTVTITIN